MTVEYLVLGVILILMGAGQIYLRHFAGGRRRRRRPAAPAGADAPGRAQRPGVGGVDGDPGRSSGVAMGIAAGRAGGARPLMAPADAAW